MLATAHSNGAGAAKPKNQNFGELTDLPDDMPSLESFDDFKQRHPGYGDEELRKLFRGLGCAGFALYVDDTKKWNMRNQSAMLVSGLGITEAGQPRIFALTELFGQGGSTGVRIQYSRHAEIVESSLHACRSLIIRGILVQISSAY